VFQLRFFLVIFLFALSSLGFSQAKFKYIEPEVISHDHIETVDDVILQHNTTLYEFETDNKKATVGKDINKIEASELREFIYDSQTRNKYKEIIVNRYEVATPEIVDLLIEAKERRIGKIIITTDFHPTMTGVFKEGERQHSDFNIEGRFKVNENDMGKAFLRLREAGFEINNPDAKYGMFAPPLLNKDYKDIQHHKELYLINHGVKDTETGLSRVKGFFGTANYTRKTHYNRHLQIGENLFLHRGVEYARKLVEAFSQGLKINKVDFPTKPLRIVYKDGSFIETGYTVGKYNQNNRIVQMLKLNQDNPERFQIKKITMSHFVDTNTAFTNELKATMLVNLDLKVDMVVDAKFVSVDGYGLAPVKNGVKVNRPFGPSVFPYPRKHVKRIRQRVYAHKKHGAVDDSLDGAPSARQLWHDKTTLLDVVVDGKAWTYVFTGSLNLSNHYQNAEQQVLFKFPADSKQAQFFKDSIQKAAEEARTKGRLWPFKQHVLRDSMARLCGNGLFSMTRSEIDKFKDLIEAEEQDFDKIMKTLDRWVKRKSTLTGEEFIHWKTRRARVERMKRLLTWYRDEYPRHTAYPKRFGQGPKKISFENFVSAATIAAMDSPKHSGVEMLYDLRSLFWHKNISERDLYKVTRDVLKDVIKTRKPIKPKYKVSEESLRTEMAKFLHIEKSLISIEQSRNLIHLWRGHEYLKAEKIMLKFIEAGHEDSIEKVKMKYRTAKLREFMVWYYDTLSDRQKRYPMDLSLIAEMAISIGTEKKDPNKIVKLLRDILRHHTKDHATVEDQIAEAWKILGVDSIHDDPLDFVLPKDILDKVRDPEVLKLFNEANVPGEEFENFKKASLPGGGQPTASFDCELNLSKQSVEANLGMNQLPF